MRVDVLSPGVPGGSSGRIELDDDDDSMLRESKREILEETAKMGAASFVSSSRRTSALEVSKGSFKSSFGRSPSRALEQVAAVKSLASAKGKTKQWQKAFGMSVALGVLGCALMFGVGSWAARGTGPWGWGSHA